MARLLPPQSAALDVVSREVGVGVITLERWREQAEQDWGMSCESVPGETEDHMRFDRSGVSGELTVTDTRFDLQLKLGFLLGAYSGKIEEKIRANLDELLGPMV